MTSQERRLKAVRQLLLLVEDLGVLEGADDRKDAEESSSEGSPRAHTLHACLYPLFWAPNNNTGVE